MTTSLCHSLQHLCKGRQACCPAIPSQWPSGNNPLFETYGTAKMILVILVVLITATTGWSQSKSPSNKNNLVGHEDREGAIIQFHAPQKEVYLLFSAHDFGEGGTHIARVLTRQRAGGSFFFTGDFLRNTKYKKLIRRLKKHGHYIGSHSDKHLLYNDWVKRDSLLVTKDEFDNDLQNSLNELDNHGIKSGKWYLPPYEWYNHSIVQWSKEHGLTVINFTPGTVTNADYTTPDMKNYRSSDHLLQRLFDVESTKGLAGNMILIHLGTDAKRTDKFYFKLDEMIKVLRGKGYQMKALPYEGTTN